jgi:uncharacterized protein (DUF1330 family)
VEGASMATYLIADLEISNPDEFKKYSEKVVATVKQYGGKYLVRGGDVQILEGASKAKRITILEFPTVEQLKKWYFSPEYQAIIGFRHRAALSNLLIVHGGVLAQ